MMLAAAQGRPLPPGSTISYPGRPAVVVSGPSPSVASSIGAQPRGSSVIFDGVVLQQQPGVALPSASAPVLTMDTCWLTMSVDFQFRGALYAHAANMFFDEVRRRGGNKTSEGLKGGISAYWSLSCLATQALSSQIHD